MPWVRPVAVKNDGLQDDRSRIYQGGRPQSYTAKVESPPPKVHYTHPGRFHALIKDIRLPKPDEEARRKELCNECGLMKIVDLPPKRRTSIFASNKDKSAMNRIYNNWIEGTEEPKEAVEISVTWGDNLPKQHHERHHPKPIPPVKPPPRTVTFCSICGDPYRTEKRRKPPHLYDPITLEYPFFSAKGIGGEKAYKSRTKSSLVPQVPNRNSSQQTKESVKLSTPIAISSIFDIWG